MKYCTHRNSVNVFEAAFPFEGYTTWLHPFHVFQISKEPRHVLKLHCQIWQQNHMFTLVLALHSLVDYGWSCHRCMLLKRLPHKQHCRERHRDNRRSECLSIPYYQAHKCWMKLLWRHYPSHQSNLCPRKTLSLPVTTPTADIFFGVVPVLMIV